jgi:hypothetical protein
MDKKPADGRRIHFNLIATSTPKLIVGAGARHAVVIATNADIRIGFSGTVASQGLLIPADNGFTDNYTADDWWVVAPTSSGTVTGFVVT